MTNRTRNHASLRSLALSLLVATLLAGCARSPAATAPRPSPTVTTPDIRSGTDVVTAMHDRYATTWYRTLTFVQRTTLTPAGGGSPSVHTWWEMGQIPGRLRIDTDSVHKGTGVLFRSDSVYQFDRGRLIASTPGVNDLLVLGFDIYGQPVERTLTVLRGRGIDVTKFHDRTWQNRPVWVVGAVAGDTTSKQFWVDKERLLFVRLLELATTRNGKRYADVRFDKYVRHDGGWVAEHVIQYLDGKVQLEELYSQVKVNVPLDEGLFQPARWSTATHPFK
jgi:hypothetical protein